MAELTEGRVVIGLAPAKPTGLGDLGIPLAADTRIKKGKSDDFAQRLVEGGIGRMFQELRAYLAIASVGVTPVVKLFLLFEVFGDNTLPKAVGGGIILRLNSGTSHLMDVPSTPLFLPYPNCWYGNRFVFDLPVDLFDRLDRIELIAAAQEVVLL